MSDKFPEPSDLPDQSRPHQPSEQPAFAPLDPGMMPPSEYAGFAPPDSHLAETDPDEFVAPLVHPAYMPPVEQVVSAPGDAPAIAPAVTEKHNVEPHNRMPQEVLEPLRKFMSDHANSSVWVRGSQVPMGLYEHQDTDAEGKVTNTEIMIAASPHRPAWVVNAETGEFHMVAPEGHPSPEGTDSNQLKQMVEDTAMILSAGHQQGFYTQRDPAKGRSLLGKDHQRVDRMHAVEAAHASTLAAATYKHKLYSEGLVAKLEGEAPAAISEHDLGILRDFVQKYAGEYEEPRVSSDGGVYTHSIIAKREGLTARTIAGLRKRNLSYPSSFSVRREGEGDDAKEEIVINATHEHPSLAVDVKTGQVRRRVMKDGKAIFQPGNANNVKNAVTDMKEVLWTSRAGEGFWAPRNARSVGSRALRAMGIKKPPPYEEVQGARAGARKALRGIKKGAKVRGFKV